MPVVSMGEVATMHCNGQLFFFCIEALCQILCRTEDACSPLPSALITLISTLLLLANMVRMQIRLIQIQHGQAVVLKKLDLF